MFPNKTIVGQLATTSQHGLATAFGTALRSRFMFGYGLVNGTSERSAEPCTFVIAMVP